MPIELNLLSGMILLEIGVISVKGYSLLKGFYFFKKKISKKDTLLDLIRWNEYRFQTSLLLPFLYIVITAGVLTLSYILTSDGFIGIFTLFWLFIAIVINITFFDLKKIHALMNANSIKDLSLEEKFKEDALLLESLIPRISDEKLKQELAKFTAERIRKKITH